MSALALTYPTVTNGVTVVDAVIHNANFPEIQTAVNSIDRTNMGPAGIDASNIIPTTNAHGIFGGVTAGVGYTFLASAATSTPLTASGVLAQSADIFDVTLTSGGTKAFAVISNGVATAIYSGVTASGQLAPVYNAVGAPYNTAHVVITSFTGTGGSVSVTLTGASTFTNGGTYNGFAMNTVASGSIVGVPASGSSIAFAGTTNGQNYLVFLIGT